MSRYSQRIHEILANADSKKITDKKKCVAELLELYENKEAVKEISKSSEEQRSGIISWSNILNIVHNLLLAEASRLSTKDVNKTVAERKITCSAILKTVSNANNGTAISLRCSDLIPLLLQILATSTYAHYHDTYLSILLHHVLPVRAYQIEMSPEQWQELLQICIFLYENTSPNMNKKDVLNAIELIVYYGCLYSHLILKVKTIFSFLEKVFFNIKTEQETLIKDAYKLANTVCQQIGTESRIALCKFSEDILPIIISLTSSNEKYKLMQLFIQAHHPSGVNAEHDAAYACDWNKWKIILESMYLIVLKDCKSEVMSNNFLCFATEVFKQIFDHPSFSVDMNSTVDPYASQPLKRRRVTTKFEKPLDMFNETEPKNVWSMIQILNVLIKKYPECLKLEDYMPFLKVSTDLMSKCCSHEHEQILSCLCELLIITLQVEEEFFKGFKHSGETKEYWDKVEDVLLRSLSGNQNEESGHKLMQQLIKCNKIHNPNMLLRLYFTKTIKWSPHSVSTLSVFCNHIPLPEDISTLNINPQTYSQMSEVVSVKISLLRWILNVPWQRVPSEITIEDFYNILTHLMSKSWNTRRRARNVKECNKSIVPMHLKRLETLETCYLSLTFHSTSFAKEHEEINERDDNRHTILFLAEDVANFLKQNLSEIVKDENSPKDVIAVITRTIFVGKVISFLNQFHDSIDISQDSYLGLLMRNSLQSICQMLQAIEAKKLRFAFLHELTKALVMLYGTRYHEDVANIIISSSTKQTLRNIFNLLNVEDKDTIDGPGTLRRYSNTSQASQCQPEANGIEDKNVNISTNGVIKTQAITALILFFRAKTGSEKLEVQISLMKNLLNFDMYDVTCLVDFKMALKVLHSLTECEVDEVHRLYGSIPFDFFLELFRHSYKDERCIQDILQVLPQFLIYTEKFIDGEERLIPCLLAFYNRLCKGRYGPQVYIKFVKCLSKITELDPNFLRSDWLKEETNKPIIETALRYVNNPFYIVRLHVADCIRTLFSSSRIDFQWKLSLFVKLKETVRNTFMVERNLAEHNKIDELHCRTVSALLSLINILRSCGTLQNEALFAIFELTVDKDIITTLVRNALRAVTSEMNYPDIIERNLNYLTYNWLRAGNTLNTYPWMIMNYETRMRFCEEHIDTLVLSYIQDFDLIEAENLCKAVKSSFEKVFENIFPRIFIWLLSHTCENNDTQEDRRAINILQKLISNEDEFQSVREFLILFNEKFGEIFLCFVKSLHDEEDFLQTFGQKISLPKLDPPYYSRSTVDKCFKYLHDNFCNPEDSLQRILATKRPSVLQKILLDLTSQIYDMKFIEHKCKAFHQYTYFVSLIIQELPKEYFNTIAMYLIRDISYTLLHLIKEETVLLSQLACKFLYSFLKTILPSRSREIEDVLRFYVTTLTPIAQKEKIMDALNILSFLIIDQRDVLSDSIAKLDSFPNGALFKGIKDAHNSLKYKKEKVYSLQQEIEHFLQANCDKNVNCSVDALVHLRGELSSRTEELRNICGSLETLRGFSEDCAQSIPHRLMYTLVKLTGSSNSAVSIEAAKCLGELGPIDLTTMILYPTENHVKDAADSLEIFTYETLKLLIGFLNDSDVAVRIASAEALYVVLSGHWGQKVTNPSYLRKFEELTGNKETPLRLDYIRPFIVKTKPNTVYAGVEEVSFKRYIHPSNEIWTKKSCGLYSEWLIEITKRIASCLTGIFTKNLIPLFTLSTEFCEMLLPRIIFLLIYLDARVSGVVCRCVNEFFNYHFNLVNQTDQVSPDTSNPRCSRETVRCMLNIVNFLRAQSGDDVQLSLDYMHIAKAAQYCSAFFTAILYTELCCETLLEAEGFKSDFRNITKIDFLCERKPEEGTQLQNILRDVYLKIGDPDAIYGCGLSHLKNYSSRVQHYIHTQKWDKVILAQDVELCFGNNTAKRGMVNALQQSGFQYLLSQFVFSGNNSSKETDDYQYECAWRLSNWDICKQQSQIELQSSNEYDDSPAINESDYHHYHYHALKCFHNNDDAGVISAIENARLSVGKALSNVSLESSKTVYEKLTQLRMLREIEELCLSKPEEYVDVLRKWDTYDISTCNEFQYVEPILTQRTIIFRSKDSLLTSSQLKQTFANTYLHIADVAESQGCLQIAALALNTLTKHENLSPEIRDELRYKESLLMWIRKDQDIARFILRSLMNERTLSPRLRAEVLRVYGNWMAEMKSENSQAVIKNYYLESIQTSETIRDIVSDQERKIIEKNLHRTQVALARFADAQFEQISTYMKSPQFEGLKECVRYSNAMRVDGTQRDKDLRRAVIVTQRQTSNDVQELENIEREKNSYLTTALKYYLMILQQSEEYNLLIFRLIALWLENKNCQEVNNLLEENLDGIPSFKFIPLIPQMAAHMSHMLDGFSAKIYRILKRCALEHPHHTLGVLLALKNLYVDVNYTGSDTSRSREEPRVLGAKRLLTSLNGSSVSEIINEMDALAHSLVMLAYLPTKGNGLRKIARDQKILKIKDFRKALVPTITIPVKPSGNYTNIVGVHKYLDVYEIVGGVNVPKKITCVGTNGICYKQLVKGRDDLRQDAVMQQVFNVMNILLKTCKETKKRKLKIRTYKVVPLTQRSGVLEWCDNTLPTLAVLVGSNKSPGVHQKYYPNDYRIENCKKLIADAEKASNNERLKVFLDCCAHVHPALHHFFMDRYSSPETWFERRLAYTRSINLNVKQVVYDLFCSVATTSMAGYILGLGDRHLSNILLDQSTAELIHIDFGYAFEESKVLPVPETVPFRLTRDIEVAMGVSGVEGIMRRSCEQMLTVMRNQRQIIITLLQVLLYDPLFIWSIPPALAHNLQAGTSNRSTVNTEDSVKTNITAERALLRIEQKLQGTEEGLPSSVAGQVEKLIQEARDPSNLSRLYCGWQAYL